MNNSISNNSIVKALYQITIEFLQFLQAVPDKEEREVYIAQVERYLNQRDVLISYLQGQDSSSFNTDSEKYSDEEKQLGAKIVQYNQMIEERLKAQLGNIELDLIQIRNKKNNQKKYANPYSDLDSADGMYFDKRK